MANALSRVLFSGSKRAFSYVRCEWNADARSAANLAVTVNNR